MSRHRVSPTAGWVDEKKMPRDKDGRPLCRWCQQPIAKGSGRRTFCSDPCVHEHKIRSNPGYAREQVEQRDKGVCGRCSLDTQKLEKLVGQARDLLSKGKIPSGVPGRSIWRRFEISFGDRVVGSSWGGASHLWEMHHKIAVVEGGGECGLEGLETLCRWCHADETAELARRRAEEKRKEKQLALLPEGPRP